MKKRRSITTCLMLTLSLFIFFYCFAYQPAVTNYFTTSPVQWNGNTEAQSEEPPTRAYPVGEITCNRSHIRYDLCSISGPTLVDPRSSTLYGLGIANDSSPPTSLKIKPYPRKTDKMAMAIIQELTLTSAPPGIGCDVTHDSPALVFSAGGYTGNFFHDFNEGFVPLFIMVNSMFPDRDVVFAIVNCRDWWPRKYGDLLSRLSCRPIIDLGRERATHCFPSAVAGLVTHGIMTVNPALLPRPKTLSDFQAFLKSAYRGAKNASAFAARNKKKTIENNARPRMVLVSRGRRHGRAVLNQKELVKSAKRIGFDVAVLDPTSVAALGESFRLLQASHAMVGVHGAGLTHELFLRPNSVFLQVVPIATEGVAAACYGNPGRALGLDYVEYKIEAKESSLLEIYGSDSLVMRDPRAVVNGNWTNMRLYMKTQNVKLDLARFNGYLRKAYQKAKKFMESEG